jgi:hypothetical protein
MSWAQGAPLLDVAWRQEWRARSDAPYLAVHGKAGVGRFRADVRMCEVSAYAGPMFTPEGNPERTGAELASILMDIHIPNHRHKNPKSQPQCPPKEFIFTNDPEIDEHHSQSVEPVQQKE